MSNSPSPKSRPAAGKPEPKPAPARVAPKERPPLRSGMLQNMKLNLSKGMGSKRRP